MAGKRRKGKGDPEGVARAQAELEHSRRRLAQTTREVTIPINEMRSRNNVTGLVNRLMHEIKQANGGAV